MGSRRNGRGARFTMAGAVDVDALVGSDGLRMSSSPLEVERCCAVAGIFGPALPARDGCRPLGIDGESWPVDGSVCSGSRWVRGE